MTKQASKLLRRERSEMMTVGLTSRIGILAVIATVLMSAGLVFAANALAHNIDLEKAWEKARDYARAKRSDPGRTYKHYATDCVEAFPGHNHIVRCTISYQSPKDKERGKWTCSERIEVYLEAHGRSGPGGIYERFGSDVMHIRHTSQRQC